MDNIDYLIEIRKKYQEEYNYYMQQGCDPNHHSIVRLRDEIESISEQIIGSYTTRSRVSKDELIRQDRERKLKRICNVDIPLFETEDKGFGATVFYAQLGNEYECTIDGNEVYIKKVDDDCNKNIGVVTDLENFNKIFLDKNEFLRQKREYKLKRINSL